MDFLIRIREIFKDIFRNFLLNVQSKPLFPPSRPCAAASVTLQRFIPLIAPEAPTALVPGAPEPRMYPRSG